MRGLSQDTVTGLLQDLEKTRDIKWRVGKLLGIDGNVTDRVRDQFGGTFKENILDGQTVKKLKKADRCVEMFRYQGWKLNKLLHANSRFLDVGSGNGEFAEAVARQLGLRWSCLEKKGSGFPVAAPNGGELVFYDGNGQLPFRDCTFSIMTAMQLLHHITNKVDYMKELYRICVPFGYLLIQDHNVTTIDDYIVLETVHAYYAAQEDHGDASEKEIIGLYLSAAHMIQLAKDVGFRFVYSTHRKQIHPGNHYYALFQKVGR